MQFLILGRGQLGSDLSGYFEQLGHMVSGTTTKDWRLGDQLPRQIQNRLPQIDVVIMAIPPVQALSLGLVQLLKDHPLLGQKRFYVCNSISLYGRNPGEVDESTPPSPDSARANELLELENTALGLSQNFVSLRLGGLFSRQRHPVFYLSGRENLAGAGEYLNGVHHQDVARAVLHLENTQQNHQRVNVVWNQHPEKSSFYTKAAQRLNLPVPSYKKNTPAPKKIVHSKVLRELGFKFGHPLS